MTDTALMGRTIIPLSQSGRFDFPFHYRFAEPPVTNDPFEVQEPAANMERLIRQ